MTTMSDPGPAPGETAHSGPPRARMPAAFRRLLVNTLGTGVTSSFVWFALTFWVFLETRSVVATGVIGGAFSISSAVLGTYVDRHRKHQALALTSMISTASVEAVPATLGGDEGRSRAGRPCGCGGRHRRGAHHVLISARAQLIDVEVGGQLEAVAAPLDEVAAVLFPTDAIAIGPGAVEPRADCNLFSGEQHGCCSFVSRHHGTPCRSANVAFTLRTAGLRVKGDPGLNRGRVPSPSGS